MMGLLGDLFLRFLNTDFGWRLGTNHYGRQNTENA
jgi:hypothetical protein